MTQEGLTELRVVGLTPEDLEENCAPSEGNIVYDGLLDVPPCFQSMTGMYERLSLR